MFGIEKWEEPVFIINFFVHMQYVGTEECKDCSDPALVFCEQCDSYYCDTCSTSQHKHPKKRNHTITRLTNETQDDKGTSVIAIIYTCTY